MDCSASPVKIYPLSYVRRWATFHLCYYTTWLCLWNWIY